VALDGFISIGGFPALALFRLDAIRKKRDPATHSTIAWPLDLCLETL
jgi:hypothetical protein